MGGRDRGAASSLLLLLLLPGACVGGAYVPCPVELDSALPADAFARCRDVVVAEYGPLLEADADAFRLRSDWVPTQDPPGERRAAVFRDGPGPDGLAVVVELRWLSIPWIGMPTWSAPRGDASAERELATRLREALHTQP